MRDRLVFYLNDERHEVAGADAALTLTDYLRRPGPVAGRSAAEALVGTKVVCSEGDCGACTVLVGSPTENGERFAYRTIDACIAFIYQLDRRHVVTVEGVGPCGALTGVQDAMVRNHGSQCGFCTPGFVMAMHGLMEQAEGADTALDDAALRLGLSGNLCRCTGYGQILEAGRELRPSAIPGVADRFDTAAMLTEFTALGGKGVVIDTAPPVCLPTTVDELLAAKADRPDAALVAGATDLGVQRNHGRFAPSAVIFTGGVEELKQLKVVGDELVIGAGVTWDEVECRVRPLVPQYADLLTRFGSPQIRNAGTLVGNLANASPIADSIPFHMVAGSTFELASSEGRRNVAIEDFYLGYKELDLKSDEAILAVRTPLPLPAARVRLYKVSKRRDMDISTATAAFWVETDRDGLVSALRIALGGVGPTVMRAREAEALLVGAPLSLEAMRRAGRTAGAAITPISDVRGGADYRRLLVENLFVKCWHDLGTSSHASNGVKT
ncbi:Nicotinate dehydrogenase FAD-subunit [Pseudobythopirellula maris]|uniref:Nicotinate dehydrogenase FAD-subunit n=1 Tax=Pseudobythopirellula maris TaxID=2527991 RepID=A0A5C5ZJW2_9BACT|nr:FAD binding domain-containing protein [Pseudobythopirellula maris]TWT87642.1 Nicotinate dehydrogenase FAD-subunit [Pseudobythopirellula maris]